MTGDPATQEWRQVLGEFTSARLRRVEAELGSALNALAAAEKHENCAWRGLAEKARAERDEALAKRDEATENGEWWKAKAREADHDLAHAKLQLETERARLAHVRADRDKARAQLAEASSGVLITGGQIYPARQDVGLCVLCGQPIVRGHAIEARNDGTAKTQWIHVACPKEED